MLKYLYCALSIFFWHHSLLFSSDYSNIHNKNCTDSNAHCLRIVEREYPSVSLKHDAKGSSYYSLGLKAFLAEKSLENSETMRSNFDRAIFVKEGEFSDARVLFLYANFFLLGEDGYPQDIALAKKYFVFAADGGLKEAQEFLGHCHQTGLFGFNADITSAVFWFAKAMSHRSGSSYALENLATIYYNLYPITAVGYLSEAANMGSSQAAHRLGICYQTGHGVGRDLQKADFWFAAAKELNKREQATWMEIFSLKG